jgi:hypothetical protein
MRQQQRRASAREWIRTGAAVTVKSYAKRYGVDRYTAYDDLTALGLALPDSAQQWAQRPPASASSTVARGADHVGDEWWIMLDGRLFFVAGYTSGGAPYGMFADEMPPYDDPL